ncbi:pectin lyase fold/virulence factor [Baffinella frigidus]|nr:pectin lyase fold/virulence factor [Cryptophyta sp. CCMP2293]
MGRCTGRGGWLVLAVAVLTSAIAPCRAGAVVDVFPGSNWSAAVLGAPAGASVVFEPGTYVGCAAGGLEPARDVALVGREGAAATVIDCEGSGRHFLLRGNISVLVQGLTLRGGSHADSGGCVAVADGAALAIEESVLANCSAFWGGAVSVAAGGALNVSGSTISNSTATHRSGAVHSLNRGGAIHALNSTVTLSRTQLHSNTAGGSGGAVYSIGSSISVVDGSAVVANSAVIAGGGFVLAKASSLELRGSVEVRAHTHAKS